MTLAIIFWVADIHGPLWLAIILLTSAPAISGSPHLVALLGFDSTSALRQLVVGTALLPVTIIPVFVFMPEIGSLPEIMMASARLSAVILSAALLAFVVRYSIMKHPDQRDLEKVDGVSTILLAIMVLGLMAAIHNEINTDPMNLLTNLVVAISVNFGLQFITTLILANSRASEYAVAMGLIAGNRNSALFMTALEITTTQPLLLFIACYQIPMYLTPILMRRFYRSFAVNA
jgi:ACR3 family arsenite transporter